MVVDGDMRRPTLHSDKEGTTNEIGLSNVLNQEVSLSEALQEKRGVHLLTSGPMPPDPTQLLGSAQMIFLIKNLAQQFDVILLDTPAFMAVADAAVLCPAVGGVLLVARRSHVHKEALKSTVKQLKGIQAKIIGLVINGVEDSSNVRYSKYYRQSADATRPSRTNLVMDKPSSSKRISVRHFLLLAIGSAIAMASIITGVMLIR